MNIIKGLFLFSECQYCAHVLKKKIWIFFRHKDREIFLDLKKKKIHGDQKQTQFK